MLYHTYYKGGEESHLTYYYYFVVIFFVTGIPQTLTPYCGCSFLRLLRFTNSLRATLAEAFDSVCVVYRCVNVCIPCVHMHAFFRGFIYYSSFFFLFAFFLAAHDRSKSSNLEFFFFKSTAIRILVLVSLGSYFCSKKKGIR